MRKTRSVKITDDERAVIKGIADRMGVKLDDVMMVGGDSSPTIVKAEDEEGRFNLGPSGFSNCEARVARITDGEWRGRLVLYDPDVWLSSTAHSQEQLSHAPAWVHLGRCLYPCLISST